jgi:hypothetical protein
VAQWRIFVTAVIRIGHVEKEIELSLVDRERMIFRMLIGRTALASSFLVDAGKRYLVTQPERSNARPERVRSKQVASDRRKA